MTRDQKAAENRRKFPEIARIRDEIAQVFGEPVKVVYASNGRESVGTRRAHGVPEWRGKR